MTTEVESLLNTLWYFRWRGMRNDTWRTMNAWREFMQDTICLRFPAVWIPIPELDHIETRHFPDRLDSVRDGWNITRLLPILLYTSAQGVLGLMNGNHRLTNARAMEVDAILAVILPYHALYSETLERETARQLAVEAEDEAAIMHG